jgi:predicted dehydrogenase
MRSTRRAFAAALTASAYSRVLGANDRVGVGFIGYGLIGAQHVYDFKNQKDADMVAMAETYQPRLEQGIAACGGKAKPYADFRKLLDDKDVEAVVVSTPDHWHALMTMMACAAGKDVYVEKPMTLFIDEGKWMTQVARKHKRVVQVGTQQRSGKSYQKAVELLRAGHIGKVHSVRMAAYRNIMPGFGRPAETESPRDLDYEMWLGPAPKRQFAAHRGLYHFRWFWDYSGGQMTNLGAHQIDILQWALQKLGPVKVSSSGGRFALEDDGETPDTQDALFDYGGGLTSIWSHREASANRRGVGGLDFFGTKGMMTVSRAGFEVIGDTKVPPENAVPTFKGHPAGGVARQEVKPELWTPSLQEKGSSDEQFDLHARNFIDCIKSRQRTIADVEDGHRTAVACHLANLSLRLGRTLAWDPVKEQILGDREAAGMMRREYRKPWDQVLRGLLA